MKKWPKRFVAWAIVRPPCSLVQDSIRRPLDGPAVVNALVAVESGAVAVDEPLSEVLLVGVAVAESRVVVLVGVTVRARIARVGVPATVSIPTAFLNALVVARVQSGLGEVVVVAVVSVVPVVT